MSCNPVRITADPSHTYNEVRGNGRIHPCQSADLADVVQRTHVVVRIRTHRFHNSTQRV